MYPNLDQEDLGLIDAIGAQQLGAAPQAQPAPQPAPKDQATPQEAATAAVAPKTEQSNAGQAPFEFFEVDMGNGQKRQYTPDQLSGMTRRFQDLNYRHQTEVAPNSKALSFLNQLRQQAVTDGHDLTDDAMAGMLEAALTAFAHNPQVGNTAPQNGSQGQSPARQDMNVQNRTTPVDPNDLDAQLAQWEQDNAVSLPPMLKQTIAGQGQMQQTIEQLTQMIQQLTQQGALTAKTAEGQLQQAQQANSAAGQQRLVNNLQQVQMKYQLPDDKEQDFMAFVQGRGYDIWELMDPALADTLASDFKNNMDAPELQRFRDMAARRQSFTGNLSPTPAGADGAAPAGQMSEEDQTLSDMTDAVHARRNPT